MSKTQNQIDKKKKELQSNLVKIQEGLDHSIEEVKENVSQRLNPKEVLKKYPLQVLGASLIIGFLIGRPENVAGRNSSSSNSITGSIGRSLKKRITQKAVDTALDFIEEKLSDAKEDE